MKNKLISADARERYRNISGIYYLIYGDKIIYIGQSVNVYSRLATHNNKNQVKNILKTIEKEQGRCNRSKQLALYMFIDEHRDDITFKVEPFPADRLNEIEEQEITKYQPPYNYRGVDIPY